MKRFGVVLGGLLIVAAFIVPLTSIPSCANMTDQQRTAVQSLTKLGLALAVSQGALAPGDSLLIGETVAVVTSPGSNREKVLDLADIGAGEAVKEGILQPGDRVVIKDALDALVTPAPAAVPNSPEGLGQEVPKPPPVEQTGSK